jgi:hypothetical protein
MDPSSLNTNTFTLTEGKSPPVEGVVSYTGIIATFTPKRQMFANTLYTATIKTGARNRSGQNMAENRSWTFTTGASPDSTNPAVNFTVPANDEMGVPINGKIALTFSEAMDPNTLNNNTFTLTGPGSNPVTGVVSYAGNGTLATFTPSTKLNANTRYTAQVSTGAEDLSGNRLPTNTLWAFTTGLTLDTTSPSEVYSNPANGANSVAVNGQLHVTFSEFMDPLTLTSATFKLVSLPGFKPVSGTVTYTGKIATFTPSVNLTANTAFTATITTQATDLAGNGLAVNKVWSFTTGASDGSGGSSSGSSGGGGGGGGGGTPIPDTTQPLLSGSTPTNGTLGVAVNGKLSVTFSEPMNPTTLNSTTFTLAGPGVTPVAGTVSYTGNTATFTPNSNLAANTLFTATITTGAKDLAGNNLAVNKVWTFTTGTIPDTIAPLLSSSNPANGATGVAVNGSIATTFNEPMDPLTITTTTFTLTGPGLTPVAGTVSYVGTTATFTPTNPLAPNTLFTATITTAVKDLAGNNLVTVKTWTFTTGATPDTTAPTFSASNPANGAIGVAVNGTLAATFSEPMAPLTITTATYTVTGPGLTPVAGTVSYAGTVATFTPTNPLVANTLFTATITTGVKDLAGNALAVNKVWTFTTGATPDTTAPTFSSSNPANGAVGVAVNSSLASTFSEPMNPLTITTTTFTLTGPGLTPVSGAVTYAGNTATFTPTNPLAGNTLFTATLTTGVKDLAGNNLAVTKTWTFTTGATPDTTAPTVITTTPDNGTIGNAVNTSVAATFSETMDPLTLTAVTFTLTGPGVTPVSGAVSYAGNIATFTPTANLTGNTTFTATITTGAKDLAGNALLGTKTWTFGTGATPDTTAPTVNSTNPANTATSIAVTGTLAATFSEPMDPLTITTATYTVTGPGLTPVTGAVTYAGNVATFTPDNDLLRNTTYTATITGGAKDLAGNALASNKVWTFASAAGPAPVNLRSAGDFVILAKAGISTVPTSAITGDIGVSPIDLTAITGFSPILDASTTFATAGQVTGRIYAANLTPPTPTKMTTAIGDMEIAYNDAAGRVVPNFIELGAGEIGGQILTPGLYKWGTNLLITTNVVLNGGANDVWILQVAGDLNQATANVILTGGALPKNVFWQIAGTIDLASNAHMEGILLGKTAVHLGTGASINGRLYAQTAVTLKQNVVTKPAP